MSLLLLWEEHFGRVDEDKLVLLGTLVEYVTPKINSQPILSVKVREL